MSPFWFHSLFVAEERQQTSIFSIPPRVADPIKLWLPPWHLPTCMRRFYMRKKDSMNCRCAKRVISVSFTKKTIHSVPVSMTYSYIINWANFTTCSWICKIIVFGPRGVSFNNFSVVSVAVNSTHCCSSEKTLKLQIWWCSISDHAISQGLHAHLWVNENYPILCP